MKTKEEVKVELDRIKALEDPEQQGYEAAPLFCELGRISPKELAVNVLLSPNLEHPDNIKRDAGVLRWCNEQSEKAQ